MVEDFIICPGVTIENNVVVDAGSVVTKNIENNVVIVEPYKGTKEDGEKRLRVVLGRENKKNKKL